MWRIYTLWQKFAKTNWQFLKNQKTKLETPIKNQNEKNEAKKHRFFVVR